MQIICPDFLPIEVFNKLKKRERRLISILHNNRKTKYSRARIMDELLIDNIRTFERLRKRVAVIIQRHFVVK